MARFHNWFSPKSSAVCCELLSFLDLVSCTFIRQIHQDSNQIFDLAVCVDHSVREFCPGNVVVIQHHDLRRGIRLPQFSSQKSAGLSRCLRQKDDDSGCDVPINSSLREIPLYHGFVSDVSQPACEFAYRRLCRSDHCDLGA
jgi:hypothetical protein